MPKTLEPGTTVKLKPNISERRCKLFNKETDHADFSAVMEQELEIKELDSRDRTPPFEPLYRLTGAQVLYYGTPTKIDECLIPETCIEPIQTPSHQIPTINT